MFVVSPYITPFSFDDEANTGDNVQLNCHVGKGDVPMNISWLQDGQRIAPHTGVSIVPFGTRTSLLTISFVAAEHAGLYTCRARNMAGVAEHSTELLVNG